MKKVPKQSRNEKNIKHTVVGHPKPENDGGTVAVTIHMPEVLAERIKCAAAWKNIEMNAYLTDALDAMVVLDEGETDEALVMVMRDRYFDKAKLPEDHIFRKICAKTEALRISDFEKLGEFAPFCR